MGLLDTRSRNELRSKADARRPDHQSMKHDVIIEVSQLCYCYGTRRALHEVSLQVPHASVFGLLGPNGSGKSTLIKILITLLRPDRGSASIAGADVITSPHDVRRRIGVVFQRPSLDGKLTVMENLRHQGHLHGLAGVSLRRRSNALLEQFAVADRAAEPAERLSGGLQRRVELAKAMLHDPQVLILDEPSSGLDPSARTTLMDHLHRLRDERGVTSVLTTHLTDEADRCDLLGILHQGEVVACGAPAELKSGIGGDVVTLTTEHPEALRQRVQARFDAAAEVLGNVVRMERARGHEFVAELVEAFPEEIDSVTVGKPTLNDVFLRRTGHALDHDSPEASQKE